MPPWNGMRTRNRMISTLRLSLKNALLKLRHLCAGDGSDPDLLRKLTAVENSEWFDGDWYLSRYPDVAEAGLRPAVHYLLSGAIEGRDPGIGNCQLFIFFL